MAPNESGVAELAAWRGPCAGTARDRVKVRPKGRRKATRSRKPSQLCEVARRSAGSGSWTADHPHGRCHTNH
jgi:hypothetical protein